MKKKNIHPNETQTGNGYFATMTDFEIKYRLGEGKKIRTHTVKDADSKKDASIRFHDECPDNSVLVEIQEITAPQKKPSDRVHRRMMIRNSFDQFILDQLQVNDRINNELIEYVGMSKAAWGRMRRNPENLYFYDMIRISEFLNIPMATLINEISKVVEENKTSGILDPARFRHS